ncbi:MAG: hypothetical protein KGJ59_01615 [Bacteroidota bacterium]|nr:hypothetical protein [Bacteroidota bacterium]
MITVLIGIAIYLLMLFFSVRFFQTVHGWDEEMASLFAAKEKSARVKAPLLHERRTHRKRKNAFHRVSNSRRHTIATAN